jgi:UDP-galactopyranose mutase
MTTDTGSAEPGIVILGGGVAGLMAALTADEAQVYEAEPEWGGVAASDTCDGFTFDRGIHVLQTTNQEIIDLLEQLGVDFGIVERSAHIYAFGKYTAFPFQINSTNLRLDRRIRCVVAYLRRLSNPEPTNYAEWIYRSIGRGFGDTFLIPYSEKFWGVHPREMSFEWTGNRVPKADVWKVLRGAVVSRNTRVGTNASFRYPKGNEGYGAVPTALRRRVGNRLHTNHRATRVDTGRKQVTFHDQSTADYKVLLSTIPLPMLVQIATDVPQEVRQAVGVLRTNSIMAVNLGIARADLSSKHWIHFPEKDIAFFRISFPHNFSPDLVPPGCASISAEVSYPTGSPPDRAKLVQRVIDDLIRVGVLRADDQVVVRHTRDIPWGYCIYDDARRQALPVIRRWLREHDIVPGGRYGLWTYFWSDEAMVSGRKAAERAVARAAGLPEPAEELHELEA